MTFLTPLAILLGFAALAGALAWSRPRPTAPQAAPEPAPDKPRTGRDPLEELWGKVGALAVDVGKLQVIVAGLPGLYQEEADRANRAAEREEKAARRADKRRAREDFESGAGDVQDGDAQLGFESGMPSVHAPVGRNAPNQAEVIANARHAIARAMLSRGH